MSRVESNRQLNNMIVFISSAVQFLVAQAEVGY